MVSKRPTSFLGKKNTLERWKLSYINSRSSRRVDLETLYDIFIMIIKKKKKMMIILVKMFL